MSRIREVPFEWPDQRGLSFPWGDSAACFECGLGPAHNVPGCVVQLCDYCDDLRTLKMRPMPNPGKRSA